MSSLNIANTTISCFSATCTSSYNVILHVHDVIQKQYSQTIDLIENIDSYSLLFYTPVCFETGAYIILKERSPPAFLRHYEV